MFSSRFGIEIEMTGITRERAARVVAEHFGTEAPRTESLRLSGREVKDSRGRTWKVVSDSSIRAKRKVRGEYVSASSDYQVELVSPPLHYREDIEDLQEVIRKLRKAGATAAKGTQCGIHIHLDGAPHTARSLSNFVKIIAAKEDLLYDALDFDPARQHWCRKTDRAMLARLERVKPRTLAEMRRVWYGNDGAGAGHYHDSRYTFLNLHSFFQAGGNHTVELRGFNSYKLHAGEIRSFIALALALNHQALTQRSASSRRTQTENPKFAMRTYLNRIGLIGDEFKNCRMHLTKHLEGNAAWRYREADRVA